MKVENVIFTWIAGIVLMAIGYGVSSYIIDRPERQMRRINQEAQEAENAVKASDEISKNIIEHEEERLKNEVITIETYLKKIRNFQSTHARHRALKVRIDDVTYEMKIKEHTDQLIKAGAKFLETIKECLDKETISKYRAAESISEINQILKASFELLEHYPDFFTRSDWDKSFIKDQLPRAESGLENAVRAINRHASGIFQIANGHDIRKAISAIEIVTSLNNAREGKLDELELSKEIDLENFTLNSNTANTTN